MNLRSPAAITATIAVLAMICPGKPAYADTIAVSTDAHGNNCFTLESAGSHTVYLVHKTVFGAVGARCRVETAPGVAWTYVSETHAFANTSGDTQSGITVCYPTCLPGPDIIVATIMYTSDGTTPDDDPELTIRVVPHPDAEVVEGMDCNFQSFQALAGWLSLFSQGGVCSPHSTQGTPQPFGCMPPLPTEQSTWGHVKALYR